MKTRKRVLALLLSLRLLFSLLPAYAAAEEEGPYPAYGADYSDVVPQGTPTVQMTGAYCINPADTAGIKAARIMLYTDPASSVAPVEVTGVNLNKSELELKCWESELLTATVLPAEAGNQELSWLSGKPEVATVDNGVVTGVSPGEAGRSR